MLADMRGQRCRAVSRGGVKEGGKVVGAPYVQRENRHFLAIHLFQLCSLSVGGRFKYDTLTWGHCFPLQ